MIGPTWDNIWTLFKIHRPMVVLDERLHRGAQQEKECFFRGGGASAGEAAGIPPSRKVSACFAVSWSQGTFVDKLHTRVADAMRLLLRRSEGVRVMYMAGPRRAHKHLFFPRGAG